MRCLRLVATLVVLGIVAYWIATLAGVASPILSLVYTVALPIVPPAAWWAVVRARQELRQFILLAAGAVTFQGVGSLLWYVAFLQDGSRVPRPPGFWTPFLYVALLLATASAWSAVRSQLRLRQAMLDYSLVFAAGACVAVAVLEHQLHMGLSAETLDAAMRPILGLLLVVLIASAMLGRWQGLPLPVGLVGLALLFNAGGSLWFSYFVARNAYVDDRYPDLLWFTGGGIALIAVSAIILRIDRPIRLAREPLPGVSPLALLLVTAGAWCTAAAVTLYGGLADQQGALCAGAAAVAWIGLAGLLRTVGALRESRAAYRRLDAAHLSLERARELADGVVRDRDATITQLAQRNVELTAIQTLLGSVLDLADERTNGELRSRLEETAGDIAAWLPPDRTD